MIKRKPKQWEIKIRKTFWLVKAYEIIAIFFPQ